MLFGSWGCCCHSFDPLLLSWLVFSELTRAPRDTAVLPVRASCTHRSRFTYKFRVSQMTMPIFKSQYQEEVHGDRVFYTTDYSAYSLSLGF